MRKKHFLILLVVFTFCFILFLVFRYLLPTSQLFSGTNVKKFGKVCKYAGECGNIVAVNCRSEVDGPFLYVDKETEEILEYCGGYCMGGPRDKYCQNCPPKEWNCK